VLAIEWAKQLGNALENTLEHALGHGSAPSKVKGSGAGSPCSTFVKDGPPEPWQPVVVLVSPSRQGLLLGDLKVVVLGDT
jgi:hypothetical protein